MASANAASKYEEITISRTKKKTGQGSQGKTTTKSVNGKVTSFSTMRVYIPLQQQRVLHTLTLENLQKIS